MREDYELAPEIADVIAAHCPGTIAGEHFLRAFQSVDFIQTLVASDWFVRAIVDRVCCYTRPSIIA
jgi:hypothetical protein